MKTRLRRFYILCRDPLTDKSQVIAVNAPNRKTAVNKLRCLYGDIEVIAIYRS